MKKFNKEKSWRCGIKIKSMSINISQWEKRDKIYKKLFIEAENLSVVNVKPSYWKILKLKLSLPAMRAWHRNPEVLQGTFNLTMLLKINFYDRKNICRRQRMDESVCATWKVLGLVETSPWDQRQSITEAAGIRGLHVRACQMTRSFPVQCIPY